MLRGLSQPVVAVLSLFSEAVDRLLAFYRLLHSATVCISTWVASRPSDARSSCHGRC